MRAILRAGIVIHVIASAPAMAQDRAAIEAGELVYDEHCANCHGAKLRPTGAMPDLKQQKAEGRARFDQRRRFLRRVPAPRARRLQRP